MKSIQIANINLNVKTDLLNWPLSTFEQFYSFKGQLDPTDSWSLEYVADEFPEHKKENLIFDSLGSWASFTSDNKNEIFVVQYNGEERFLKSKLKINSEDKSIKLYCREEMEWGYPFDELLFLNAFSINKSLLIHSCSYSYNNEGYLFCGVSGSGKTTLATLLDESEHLAAGEVMCDERNTITNENNKLWLSSTPWYGSGHYCKAMTVPLKKIIILNAEHKGMSLTPYEASEAYTDVFKTIFLPHFSKQGTLNSLDLITEILEGVDIYKLNYDKTSADVPKFLLDSCFSQG